MVSLHEAAMLADQDADLVGAYQHEIDRFLEDFRVATPGQKADLIAAAPVVRDGRLAALLAAIAQTLCDQDGLPYPEWLGRIGRRSPRPFFVLKGNGVGSASFAFSQMLESPPCFFSRDVFVPDNYLSRA